MFGWNSNNITHVNSVAFLVNGLIKTQLVFINCLENKMDTYGVASSELKLGLDDSSNNKESSKSGTSNSAPSTGLSVNASVGGVNASDRLKTMPKLSIEITIHNAQCQKLRDDVEPGSNTVGSRVGGSENKNKNKYLARQESKRQPFLRIHSFYTELKSEEFLELIVCVVFLLGNH